MKKVIRLTESDLTRIVKRVINEMEVTEQPVNCTEKDFKNSVIDSNVSPFKAATLKVLLNSNGTKFKVMDFDGSPVLNGKEIKTGMIITPQTTISLCQSDRIYISGMGYPEAKIEYDGGDILFTPQYA